MYAKYSIILKVQYCNWKLYIMFLKCCPQISSLTFFSLAIHIFQYWYLLQSWISIYVPKNDMMLTLENYMRMNNSFFWSPSYLRTHPLKYKSFLLTIWVPTTVSLIVSDGRYFGWHKNRCFVFKCWSALSYAPDKKLSAGGM